MDAGQERPARDAAAMKYRAVLQAVSVVLMLSLAPPGQAAEPASDLGQKLFCWKVTGPQGVVYLLGTLHVGRADFYPLPAILETSFKQADTLITEAELTEPQASSHLLKVLLEQGVYPPGDSIAKHIGQETHARLTRYIATTKELASSYARLKPWFLSFAITLVEAKRMGFDASNGVDRHFVDEATEMHKPIATLETAEAQLKLMSSFPDELQDKFLLSTLVDAEHKTEIIDGMIAAWKSGNAEAMDEATAAYPREYPELKPVFEKMFGQRNDAMTQKIERFLQTPKTYFVAVGAGHLTGERGILSQLRGKHYDIEQLQDRGIKSAAKFSR
jgi:uncharacterized protein YbaP (TraB family)